MAIPKGRSKRKITGGLYKAFRKRKKRELGNYPTLTSLGEFKNKVERVFGGNTKVRLRSCDFANVVDKDGKVKKVKILKLIENKANKEFLRKKIITKGAVVETELGKAIVTSRPGQDGVINARLIE